VVEQVNVGPLRPREHPARRGIASPEENVVPHDPNDALADVVQVPSNGGRRCELR
jgi:hypothetical protein